MTDSSIQGIKELLETIRVEALPDMAYVYDIDEHVARLFISISELGFSLPQGVNDREALILWLRNQVKNKAQYFFTKPISFISSEFLVSDSGEIALNSQAKFNPQALFKLRVVYSKEASLQIDIEPYTRDLQRAWQVKILSHKEFYIQTTDPIWRHKFLPRPDTQTLGHSATCDEVIWCNEHGHICEGSFTNVFFFNAQGQLCTPSLDCNILPGIMRSKIIEAFEVIEGYYYPEDLRHGFLVVNSMFVKNLHSLSVLKN